MLEPLTLQATSVRHVFDLRRLSAQENLAAESC